MKTLSLLLLAFSLCLAQETQNTSIDGIKAAIGDLSASQREIKSSVDSLSSKFASDNFISVKAAKETQELHNIAFDKMQSSFSIFTNKVIAIITLLGLFVGFLSFLNFKQVGNSKKELEKIKKDLKDFEDKIETIKNDFKEEIENQEAIFENTNKKIIDLEEKSKKQLEAQKTEFKEEIENQKNDFGKEFSSLKNEFENKFKEEKDNDRRNFKTDRDNIFREIAHNYFIDAMKALADVSTETLKTLSGVNIKDFPDDVRNNLEYHFKRLSCFYKILITIKLSGGNFYYYDRTYQFIGKYEKIGLTKFSPFVEFRCSFLKFKNYCEEEKEENHLIALNDIWKELRNKLGEDIDNPF
jgi:gas vesicle protein